MKKKRTESHLLLNGEIGAIATKKKIRLSGPAVIILLVIALACLGFSWFHREEFTYSRVYSIESTSEMTFGQDGQTLVIDNGKETLLVLDADGNLIRRYDGGSDNAPFYYAVYAAQTTDGSIYLVDIKYGERGNLLDRERIIRLSDEKTEVLYEVDYTTWDAADTPLQYGRIVELQADGDTVYFLLDAGDTIELKQLTADGSVTDLGSVAADGVKNDASYDVSENSIVVVGRTGEMKIYNVENGTSITKAVYGDQQPYDVAARNGEVYYTELLDRTVRHFSLPTPYADEMFCSFDELPFKLDVSADGKDLLVTDQVGFYRLTNGGHSVEYTDSAPVTFFGRIMLLWAVLCVGGLCALALLLKLILAIAAAAGRSENAMRIVLIVVAALAVSLVVSSSLLTQLIDANTEKSERQVALFSELLVAEIDEESLLELDTSYDYGTEAFWKVKTPLDEHIWGSYEDGEYFYYIIYRSIGGNIVMIMDFEDTMPCARPQYIDDPEDNIYSEVMRSGEIVQATEISAYGAWSFQLTPIYGEDGSIIAELDVGQNLDMITRRKTELTREMIIGAIISTVVAAMLLLEVTFLISHVQRRRTVENLDNTQRVPLRTMMYLIYMADAMQDAFIAILCSQLYQGGLPIPDGVAIALPMSGQLLLMALFSIFAGGFVERFGSRFIMTLGMLLNLAGFLLCMIMGSYSGLLIGKMLIGAGMGAVYVSCNAVAATGSSGTLIAEANAAISAGTLAGLTIGAGLSSILLSMGNWRLIYLAGAVICVCGVLVAASSGDVRMGRAEREEREEQMLSAKKFFTSRRVIGFLLLVLLPFMMAMSYREYFFPLFSNEHGINEVRIGQIYLVCGMLTLYIGPGLSAWFIKRLGAYWSIIAASAAMGINMLLFVFFPSLVTVILGVVLLSLIISFAFTCQYTYYELTPEIMLYGEGRAVGVYSVFESLGQTIGPVAYGAALTFGSQKGIGIFSGCMLVLLALFAFLMRHMGKLYRE